MNGSRTWIRKAIVINHLPLTIYLMYETLECLDKIRQFVSSEEYFASIEAVRREA